MESSDYYYSDEELEKLVARFDETVGSEASFYFEPEELEAIIDFYLKADNLTGSKTAIEYGLKLYPGHEGLQILNIHFHVLDNKMDTAEKMATEFIQRFPDNVDAYLVLASVRSDRGDHTEAVELLEKAIEMDQTSEPLITALSMEYQILGKHRKAINLYKRLLEQDPEDDFALNEIIFVYELAGEIEEAITYLREFTDRFPFNQNAWFHLANAYNLNNEPDKAIDAYDYSLAIDASFMPALFGKGHSLLFNGDVHDAIECFKETAETESFKAASFFSLGEAYAQLNNFGSAADYYLKSIESDVNNPEARMGLANSLFMLGLDDEALRHVEMAIIADPERADTYHLKGTVLLNLERYEEAIAEFRNCLRIDKDSDAAWLDLSEAWHFHAGTNEALEILEEAEKSLEIENALINYRKAALLFESGQNQEAVSQLLLGLAANFDLYPSIFDYNKTLEDNEIISEIVSLFLNQ